MRLRHTDGRVLERKATGDGPVDAAYKAIVLATGVGVTVRKFEVHAVTIGEDAQGEAILYVEHNGRSYRGSSVSTNIIEAASRALLEVINRIELSQKPASSRRAPRERSAQLAQSTVSLRSITMPIPATPYIWFNGKLVPWEKATVHVLSHALHYGSSVFEGVRAYETPRGWRSSGCAITPAGCSIRPRSTASRCRSRPSRSTTPAAR